MIMIESNNYMYNLLIVYYKFFIRRIAKVHLGPFQTSMMDFFHKFHQWHLTGA